MTTHHTQLVLRRDHAEEILVGFTVTAAATGAIPVPGASAAIIAENAVMVNAVASAMGVEVSLATVTASLGAVAGINVIGRTVFVEGARLLGWFAGPLGVAGVCALGATTAAIQTWVLGQLTIAICENGGRELPKQVAEQVAEDAKVSYERVRERVERG